VRIGAFFLSKYEMTQAQWERISGSNPSQLFAYPASSSLLPVESVNWVVSAEVSMRLGLRLPSESEWEYAARAETDTIWWTGDEPESLEGAANIADRTFAQDEVTYLHESWLDDGARRTAQVGSYAPNGFGLHDVIGNVQELCASTGRGDDGEGKPFVDDSRDRNIILRGGSWQSLSSVATSTIRLNWKPTAVDYDTGLRPARDIEE
jgi:formylglycine-generating enzyme required for sulfatase activity